MGQPRSASDQDKGEKWQRSSQAAHNFLKPSSGLASDRIGSFTKDIKEIVNKRDGSVLTRHTILKADRCSSQYDGDGDGEGIELLGGPNFRKSDLNIFGVAQPTSTGLATVLTFLGAGPLNPEGKTCTWISTREEPLIYINEEPFVLRDAASPAENIQVYAGISQARLEQMETKLRQEVLDEATLNGGLVLVHEERPDGSMAPCLVAIESVKTGQQIFSDLLLKGYRVDYRRIPMTHGFSPMDPFIDEFISAFQTVPLEHSMVFSCGLGIGRTTFGMLVGLLIRRAMSLVATGLDPFEKPAIKRPEHHEILRLICTLEYALGKATEHQTAIHWILERDQIIENLTEALHGNYKCILDLVRVLHDGIASKRIVDEAIDRCQTYLNLREWILINRVKHSVKEQQAIDAATTSMERYFALIALCAYLTRKPNDTFTGWMKSRPEIWNMFVGLRRLRNKLKLFLPVDQLVGISNAVIGADTEKGIQENKVVKNRSGSVLVPHTILKSDLWFNEYKLTMVLAGAENFRQVAGFPVFGVAQPRVEGIRHIIEALQRDIPEGDQICWINIREEPLIYIHGDPYVLRDRFGSLRNMKSFQGIPASRLEQMELRLKDDIMNEVQTYSNTLLVHTEDSDGNIFPIWENVDDTSQVATISEVFQGLKALYPQTHYFRIPVTAEDAPEPADFDYILRIICSFPANHVHMIFNCQIGAGRSTTGTIVACQVMNWRAGKQDDQLAYVEQAISKMSSKQSYYKAIQSILRAIRFGLESKLKLDKIVDAAAAVVNIRLHIDDCKQKASLAVDPNEARKSLRKGISALRRYCLLLLFQAYLDENDPEQEAALMETFADYLSRHPEFEKLLLELEHNRKLETLEIDTDKKLGDEEGHALTSEVASVIKDRRGNVLAPLTILKYDHFPGCQKMSLSERLEGAPNFRQVLMPKLEGVDQLAVYGVAMPKAEAIKLVLEKMQAHNGQRRALWISLREEPVAFVKGRPFVLRVVKDPVANIEMTGIISERVESMEERLKVDILAELKQFGNNLLLHEEEMGKYGYEVIPVWEHVEENEIATPAEVYANICKEGYDLTYIRIPITDEQAPIPAVFDILFKLIWEKPDGTDVMFNCQMGRGRTTTGMIISSLIYLIRNDVNVETIMSPTDIDDKDYYNKHYLAGEYKLILHLVSVLDHGKQSKRYADFAIDQCSAIQNLREAIFNFKARCSSSTIPETGRQLEATRAMGLNYLVRYYYLIVFAEFLMQRRVKGGDGAGDAEFSTWLGERREIMNLLSKPDTIDFS